MKISKLILVLILVVHCWGVGLARAVDEPEDLINYAHSNWIVSGFYKINDLTVNLLRAPFSYALRETGKEKWGMDLLLPATIGFHDNEDGNVGTVTFVPGIRKIGSCFFKADK